MKYFLIGFLLLHNSVGFGQITMSKTDFDLGEISLLNEDVIDLNLKSLSDKSIFILRIETDRQTKVQYTSKNIQPFKIQTLRIKLNPTKKGKISKKVILYLSNNTEPIALKITANVKEIPKNNKQACPDFRSIPTQSTSVNTVVGISKTVLVGLYDENSSEEHLAAYETDHINTKVIISNSETTTTTTTTTIVSEKEEAKTEFTEPKPIKSTTTITTVRREKPTKIRKTPEERRNAPSLGTILFGKEDIDLEKEATEKVEEITEIEEPVVADENKRVDYENEQEEESEELVKKQSPEIIEKTTEVEVVNPNLLADSYKPNNIVFLIDASTSMRKEERMEILKKAMINLVTPLRDIDYLSIVTYSGEATVVLKPTSGNFKDEIIAAVENIKADGRTQAVKGIKKAIEVGKNNFKEDGNNQIFLATDGAFDIGRKNKSLRRKIKSTSDNGLTIDVLGIKNDKWTNKSLKEIAELGKGSLIKIKSFNDADKVLSEVKKKSTKN